jgi:hypothetical protein
MERIVIFLMIQPIYVVLKHALTGRARYFCQTPKCNVYVSWFFASQWELPTLAGPLLWDPEVTV